MTRSVSSRLLAVLGSFDEQHARLTLTEVARRSGVPLSTAHRLLAELAAWGAVQRDASGEYRIGRRVWRLGLLASDETDLRRAAEPFLHDIHAATRATVHLAVREGIEVLSVDRVSGHSSVPIISTVGGRLPLHATGVGKVLLAHAPPDVQQRALARLVPATMYTVTQPARLRSQLDRVRREGFATTVDEMTLGASSVGVPIVDRQEVVAALGIVVPDLRRDRPRLVAALQVAAHGIARSLPRDRTPTRSAPAP